jgi:hypothetical protein
MLDSGAKEALQKAMGALVSGKMKSGDSMIVKGEEKSEPMTVGTSDDTADEGLGDIAGDIASVMGLGPETAEPLKDLLSEFVERCISKAKN